ncbi:putative integral membrane protein [Babesia bovis T2Bo]|uniref:Membrane protein, putative n=1 Tax=Babesia bovis TaxID=5865 RepID=A7APV4_BABBO|nr:putative integral membrane protein [Babesia bovis T2Bo]EDO08588.1 putative integral membrane protein [Babesia bovis T2Bo]|eukprot:XP_001612156.1 membrane protein [Babesia bovis T2Bo]
MDQNMIRIFVCAIALIPYIVYANEQQRYFAAFSVHQNGSNAFLAQMPLMNDHIYLAYHNTSVEDSSNRAFNNEGIYLPDNVNPGLSILSYRNPYLTRRVSENTSYVESWCFALTAVFVSGKLPQGTSKGNNCSLELFYHRCLDLNGKLDFDISNRYTQCLKSLPSTLTVKDAYLFEKWARECPKPLYADKNELYNIAEACNAALDGSPSPTSVMKQRHCFFHDILTMNWTPFSQIQKNVDKFKTLSMFTVTEPPKKLDAWQYQHMSKVAEIALGLPTMTSQFLKNVLQCSTDEKTKNIASFLSKHAKNLQVKYYTAAITSRNGQRKNEISFAVSFECNKEDQLPEFDFIAREDHKIPINSLILGDVDPMFQPGKPNAKIEYLNMEGEGQHRTWTVSITINVTQIKKLLGFPTTIYLKVAHMLDGNMYIDNDELNDLFNRLESEVKVTGLTTSEVDNRTGKPYGTAMIEFIKTPFVNIEDGELNSSPIIWYGYIALDTWSLTYEHLKLQYRLPMHVRYLHMNKGMTKEIADFVKSDEVLHENNADYSLVTVSEPMVFFLHTTNKPQKETGTLPPMAEQYLKFKRSTSFLNLVGAGYKPPVSKNANKMWWRRIYITKSELPNAEGPPASVCAPTKTKYPFSTRTFSAELCPGKKDGHIYMDHHTYLTLMAPIGHYKEFGTVTKVTIATTIAVAAITLLIVIKSLMDMTDVKRKTD